MNLSNRIFVLGRVGQLNVFNFIKYTNYIILKISQCLLELKWGCYVSVT